MPSCPGVSCWSQYDKKGHFSVCTVIAIIVIILTEFSERWISCCRVLNVEIGPEQHHTTLMIVIFILAIPTREELTHIAVLSLGILGKFVSPLMQTVKDKRVYVQ